MTINNVSRTLLDGRTWTELFLYFAPAVILLDRYASLVWFSLGFFGNILSFVVWMTPKIRRQNSSAIYLAALSVTDFSLLLLMIIRDLEYAWDTRVLRYDFTCRIFQVIYMTCQYMSPLLVCAFTVERWIAICYPFHRDSLCTPRRAVIVVIVLNVAVISINMVQAYFWAVKDTGECGVVDAIANGLFWKVYTWSIEFVMSAAVPILTLIFNLLVIQELTKINRSNSDGDASLRSTTTMLLCVSFYLIFTTLPAGLVYALQSFTDHGSPNLTDEEILQDPTWQRYFRMMIIKTAIDEIALSHFACNFIIFFATGRIYRNQVARLFGCLSSDEWMLGGCRPDAISGITKRGASSMRCRGHQEQSDSNSIGLLNQTGSEFLTTDCNGCSSSTPSTIPFISPSKQNHESLNMQQLTYNDEHTNGNQSSAMTYV